MTINNSIIANSPSTIYQDRINQLDGWLRNKFGRNWDKLLLDNSLNSSHEYTNSDLSKFHLLANYIIRIFKSEGYDAAYNSIQLLSPLNYYCIVEIPNAIGLFDNPLIQADLMNIQHPSLPPGSVTPTKEERYNVQRNDMTIANNILNMVPKLKEESLNFFGAICFVESPKLEKSGECISTSSKYVPGLVYSSEVAPILLAECIIHESAHLQLFSLELVDDLYKDFECSIETPLRPDLRPPAGLLHQMFVLVRLKEMYGTFSKTSSELLFNSKEQIRKRLKNLSDEYNSGAEILKASRSRFTTAGNKIIDQIV